MAEEKKEETTEEKIINYSVIDFDKREIKIDIERQNIIIINRESHESSE